jgi:hypothetical protein
MRRTTLVSGASGRVEFCMPTVHDMTRSAQSRPRAVLRIHALHDPTQPGKSGTTVALPRAATRV